MRIHLLAAACSFIAVAALGDMPLPATQVSYSADRTIASDAGTFTGKVNVSGLKERAEINMEGMRSVMIIRGDTQSGILLMPEQRMAMTLDYADARQQSPSGPPADVTITEVGAETLEGIPTRKYEMRMKDGSAGGLVWVSNEGIVMKMDLVQKQGTKETHITTTLKNVMIGAQDAALFEVPAGYTQMPAMGGFGMPRMGRPR
jgi:hypothetical protein